MPYEITQDEYVELGGVPLATPAWEVTDLAPLWDTGEVRGDDRVVPYRRGVLPYRRSWGARIVELPLVIFGDASPEGVAAPPGRGQLWANRNLLVQAIRPLRIGTPDGTRTLTYHAPDGATYTSPASVIGNLRPQPKGPSAFAATLRLSLTAGVLRSTSLYDASSPSVPGGGTTDFDVDNDGTVDQDAIRYTLIGTATSVVVTNLTADPGGSVFLTFGGALTGGVELDTDLWTAVRAGTLNVLGLITFGGFERWLPLVPGTNTLRIQPTGGTCTLRVRHYPPLG